VRWEKSIDASESKNALPREERGDRGEKEIFYRKRGELPPGRSGFYANTREETLKKNGGRLRRKEGEDLSRRRGFVSYYERGSSEEEELCFPVKRGRKGFCGHKRKEKAFPRTVRQIEGGYKGVRFN